MFVGLFLLAFRQHRCANAELRRKHTKTFLPVEFEHPPRTKLLAGVASARKPIRIQFDLTQVTTDGTDGSVCIKVGQSVTWDGTTYSCSEDDLLNETKIAAIKGTIANAKTYLESILSVDRISKPFPVKTNPPDYNTAVTQAIDTDFYVIVVVRPYDSASSTLAQAVSVLWSDSTTDKTDSMALGISRPIEGVVYLNGAQIPLQPEDYNSSDREFFATVYHEMIHALGVTDSDYKDWYNPATGLKYGDDFPLKKYNSTKYKTGKQYNIMTTPSAHRYAAEFFGAEEFEPGIPAGIEIEDGGGGGTALSHPEARVYHDDFFVGFSVAPARLTAVALVFLNDTGFYDVNFSRAEPSAWLNNEAVGVPKNPSWALGPPEEVYPSYYLCQPDEIGYEQCSYDLTSGAGCRGYKQDCTNATTDDEKEFCRLRSFTDPKHLNMMGPQETHDFTFYKSPYENIHCTDTNLNANKMTTWNGENYGGESMCALSTLYKGYIGFYAQPHSACYRMTCEDDGSLAVYVEGDKHICTKEGQKLIFIGFAGTIRCPDPARACRVRKLYGQLTKVENSVPKYIGLTMKQLAIIIITILCVLIALFFFCSIKRTCQKWKYEKLYEQQLKMQLEAKQEGLNNSPGHHHRHHKKEKQLDDLQRNRHLKQDQSQRPKERIVKSSIPNSSESYEADSTQESQYSIDARPPIQKSTRAAKRRAIAEDDSDSDSDSDSYYSYRA